MPAQGDHGPVRFSEWLAVGFSTLDRAERLYIQGNFDSLTVLPNRQLLKDQLEQAINRAFVEGRDGALLFIDLDGFKAAGDELLTLAAARISGAVRDGDTVARLGGNEFTVLMDDVGNDAIIRRVSERILTAFDSPFRVRALEHVVTASIGVAVFPHSGQTGDEILCHADTAMYAAKAAGGRTVNFFSMEMNRRVQQRVADQADLRHAIERGQMAVHYQPQVDLSTGRIVGVEALARWTHPERGPISPAVFIALAEDSGVIIELGQWILETACHDFSKWMTASITLDRLSVNVSIHQLRHHEFPDVVRTAISSSGMDPRALDIEVTESVFASGRQELLNLHRLRDFGTKIAIDDFGSGYSDVPPLSVAAGIRVFRGL